MVTAYFTVPIVSDAGQEEKLRKIFPPSIGGVILSAPLILPSPLHKDMR